jgi:hypothetical protein
LEEGEEQDPDQQLNMVTCKQLFRIYDDFRTSFKEFKKRIAIYVSHT